MAMTHQLPVAGVVEAVIAGVQEGCKTFGVEARLIGIMSRTFGEAACLQELEALLAHRDHITALDLAGDELGFPVVCSSLILTVPATLAGVLLFMLVKLLEPKVFGRRSVNWVPNVLVTALKPLRIGR